MKKILFSIFLAGCSTLPIHAQDADSTGLPGDQLDLYAVLDLFKTAESIEAFEQALNSETNAVNNLDLNGDDQVDYIRVVDRTDSGAHAITLQVAVSESESQDIAVIELEKDGEASAVVQLVGDEDLYGKDYVVEPAEQEGSMDKKFGQGFVPARPVVVNVWGWRCVRFVYAPAYVVWVSPYRWGYYPRVWRPWRPVAWRVYHPRFVHHRVHYRVVHVHRVSRAHRCYHRQRVVSPTVRARHAAHHNGARTQAGGTQRKNSSAGNASQARKGGKGNTQTRQGGGGQKAQGARGGAKGARGGAKRR
ncbi:MAG: hypothetical protein ACRCYO_16960 [Bacteroidia bacterium]